MLAAANTATRGRVHRALRRYTAAGLSATEMAFRLRRDYGVHVDATTIRRYLPKVTAR